MKAVFLDRDGVINEMVYYPDHGIIDSPFVAEQFELKNGVNSALAALRDHGYLLILVSNQPGIAKGNMTQESFDMIRNRMYEHLSGYGITLDGEYYCFHHPDAILEEYRVICDCRKPEPGLLIQASREHLIDLTDSWMIGDGVTDIMAGQRAGCRSILVARMKCEICQLLADNFTQPDAVLPDIEEAARYIINNQ